MTRVASYVVNEPQMHRAPFIRVLLANEWESTTLKRILFIRSSRLATSSYWQNEQLLEIEPWLTR